VGEPTTQPEGTEVLVQAVQESAAKPVPPDAPSIWLKLPEPEGTADLPPDAAGKLGHYPDGAEEREA
jgi:hypothetical protein